MDAEIRLQQVHNHQQPIRNEAAAYRLARGGQHPFWGVESWDADPADDRRTATARRVDGLRLRHAAFRGHRVVATRG
jgi:hypothetical protein